MKIRRALPSDVNSIIANWRVMVEEHAAIDSIYRLREGAVDDAMVHFGNVMADEDRLLIVAEESDGIVGYLVASIRMMPPVFECQRIGLISELSVSPEMRRKGLGRALFEHARDWCLTRGLDRIEVRTLIGNQQSAAFWQSVGFEAYAAEYCLKMPT